MTEAQARIPAGAKATHARAYRDATDAGAIFDIADGMQRDDAGKRGLCAAVSDRHQAQLARFSTPPLIRPPIGHEAQSVAQMTR